MLSLVLHADEAVTEQSADSFWVNFVVNVSEQRPR